MASFLFDLDGTLAPNGKQIDSKFGDWFKDFQDTHDTYLVTGTSHTSAIVQLGSDILNKFKIVFTACGNEVRRNGKLEYESTWKAPKELEDEINLLLKQSKCPTKTGTHYQQRTGMVSFSTVGRGAFESERAEYIAYDKASGERESMQVRLGAMFPDFDVTIAGDLGLDVYPRGNSKAQVVKWIENKPLIFYGDNTRPGGNDFPLACVADLTHQVDDWQHTWELLRLINP